MKQAHWAVLATLLIAPTSIAQDKKEVRIELKFSVAEFDPDQPRGTVECIVHNGTDKQIRVPSDYSLGFDSDVVLYGIGNFRWPMRLVRPVKQREAKKAPLVDLPAGQSRVVFKSELTDVLMNPQGARWSWQACPLPPKSPIHSLRGGPDSAQFWFKVKVGDVWLESEKSTLKVKKP
ncbi:MAG: hypothetical protein AB7K24_23180 [Gemmataceae bacterium]